ncbi:MAG: putative permease YjgP/YjgQ family protein [Bacteroidetes bacterium ADurb.Bin141]|nr:MAG: putative permease YjgP/YjgQ family protein [Bacteroidetes bacterium ADurb.Bin141]
MKLPVKKLTSLVLTSFIGPFIMTFFIALFVLLMQFLWKYIDDLVGKGLDWWTITKLLSYTSTTLVPLALPLAILLSSIMTFGNLAEHYEIVAAKSAGISLQRLMRPLIVVAICISVGAFFFSNYVLPYSNLKMGSLLYDVRQQKPALFIKEGIFYNGIDGYSIKIGKKLSDGKSIRNIMIYDHTNNMGNHKVVVADSGSMVMTDDKRYLILTLFNGHSYEEQQNRRRNYDTRPLLRTTFQSEIIRFDLSSFELNRTNEDLFKDNYQMLNIYQLNAMIDTFQMQMNMRKYRFQKDLIPYYQFLKDSSLMAAASSATVAKWPILKSDSKKASLLFETATAQARTLKSYIESTKDDLASRNRAYIKYNIEWHRKFTLSIACLLLFLIGAPLGAIIRKGGLGLPIVISIAFFLCYHIISITGEKFAKEGVISVERGMWQSSIVLLPIGLFLVYKATHDSALFDMDAYKSFFRKLFRRKVS